MSSRVRYQKEGRKGRRRGGGERATDRIVDWGIILRRLFERTNANGKREERIGVKKVAGGAGRGKVNRGSAGTVKRDRGAEVSEGGRETEYERDRGAHDWGLGSPGMQIAP